jgi:predicted metalloprotease with PDZ domain
MKYLKTRAPASAPQGFGKTVTLVQPGESVQEPLFCYMNIAAWGNQNAQKHDIEKAIMEEAKQINADYVLLGDFKSQQVGAFSQHLGYGIVTHNPVFQNGMGGTACNISEVSLGIVHDKGQIQYVKKDSIADKKGLKEGMKIIAVNGRSIASDEYAIPIEINSKSKGEVIDIEYLDIKQTKKSMKVKLE